VRLKVDVRKWLASKLLPKVYGEKLNVEAKVAGAIQHSHNIDAMSLLDKARAIQYTLSRAAEVEARSAPLKKFVQAQVAVLRRVADTSQRPWRRPLLKR
jgi:Bacteriophage Sf6, terminase small subunit-like